MEKQKKMKNTHEIIYVARTGESKRVVSRICRFETAEEAQRCINLLKSINNRQQRFTHKKSTKKQWSETEIMRLQEVFDKEDDALEFALILNADIRAGELCALTWSDVDLEKGTVKISKLVDKFTFSNSKPEVKYLKQPRVVTLPENLVDKLSLKKQRSSLDNDYIFNNGGILKARELNLRLKKALENAGIDEKVSLHDLRRMSNIKRKVER